jgi:hypothetical protein
MMKARRAEITGSTISFLIYIGILIAASVAVYLIIRLFS